MINLFISGSLRRWSRGLVSLCISLAAVLSLTGRSGAQEIIGQPWTGLPGITETVDQIMAREEPAQSGPLTPQTTGKPKRINPDRTLLPLDPASPKVAAWPPLPQDVPPVAAPTYQSRNPQTLGTAFTAVTLGTESGFIPPDTMGDVGPTQILVGVNGRIKVFNKSGAVGGLNVSMNTFFTSVRNGSGISDPIVRYDRLTDRWFVIAINVSTPNRIVLAMSSPGTITGTSSFTFFQFQQDTVGTVPNADTGNFADYPMVGLDVNAIYIGARMFSSAGPYYGTTGWVVRKSSMTSGGPIVVTAFRQMGTTSVGPDAPRGVHNDDPAATQGYFISPDVAVLGRLVLRRVSSPGGTPTLSGNINMTVPATSVPENVPAQGSTTALEAVGDRLFAAHIRTNRVTGLQTLWTSHSIEVNSSGVASSSGARDAMRWYEIQNFAATPTLRQSGTLFDNAASAARYYWMGSCNMSGQGHMAIASSIAATDEFAGASTAGRLGTDTLGTLQAPTDIIAGVAAYNQVAGGRNRWGDYSHTSVDPSDDMTMWTFQEYCSASNIWAIRVVQLRAPAPVTPTTCSPASVDQGASNVDVIVTGASVAGTGFFDPGAGYPNRIAASVGGAGVTVNSVTWNSPTQVTLNVTVAAGAATGARSVTVTNPDGQAATSGAGILTVNSSGCTSPTITADPTGLTRCVGAGATFSVTAGGSPTLGYQWRKGGSNIDGANSSSYSIPSVSAGDAGSYDCTVTNSCGSVTSAAAGLVVQTAPEVTGNPSPQTACEGGAATFLVSGSGSPAPTFQWRRNTTDIPGATSATLNLSGITAGDAGSYDCVLTNACGSVPSAAATLTVNTPPSITLDPAGQSACVGVSVTLNAAASGSPAPTFQWRKGGFNIDGATSASYTIPSVSTGDAGSYDCVATNSCGSDTSAAAMLSVDSTPQITLEPVAQTVCAGSGATFMVAGGGSPAPTFQWRKGGFNIDGATSPTLNIAPAVVGDAGDYDCVLTNICGSVTSVAAALTVHTAPAVTTNPDPQTVCEGSPVTFIAAGTGDPAPTFQWRFNGADISGATSPSYSIPAAASGDMGGYDCVLTNSCGAATTTAAALVVEVCQPCNTDYNQDGGGDNTDVTDLANDIASGIISFPGSNPDFNNDGGADNTDVTDLANTIAGGPCP